MNINLHKYLCLGVLVEPSDTDHDMDEMRRNQFRDHDDDEELDYDEMMDAEDEEDDEELDEEYADKNLDMDDEDKEMLDEEIPRRVHSPTVSSRPTIKHHFKCKSNSSSNKTFVNRKKQLNSNSSSGGHYKRIERERERERGETASSDESGSVNQSNNLKAISVNYGSDSSSKSNRDTMSYLKAKRIVRHKPNDNESQTTSKRQKIEFSP